MCVGKYKEDHDFVYQRLNYVVTSTSFTKGHSNGQNALDKQKNSKRNNNIYVIKILLLIFKNLKNLKVLLTLN